MRFFSTSKLAKGAAQIALATVGQKVMTSGMLIVVSRKIGAASIGAYGEAINATNLIGMILGMGLSTALVKSAAQYPAQAPAVYRKSARQLGASLVLIAVGIFIIPNGWRQYLFGGGQTVSIAIGSVTLAGVEAQRTLQIAYLTGRQEYGRCAAGMFVQGAVMGVTMAFLGPAYGAIGIIAGAIVGSMASLIWSARETAPVTEPGDTQTGPHSLHLIMSGMRRTGYKMLLANIIAAPGLVVAIRRVIDVSGYTEIGKFYSSMQWHGPLVLIPGALAPVALASIASGGEGSKRERRVMQSLRVALVIGVVGMVVVAPPIILAPILERFYGPTFQGMASTLRWCLLAAPLHSLCKYLEAPIISVGTENVIAVSSAMWLIVLLAVTWPLAPTWGAVALGMALFIAYAVQLCILSMAVLFRGRLGE